MMRSLHLFALQQSRQNVRTTGAPPPPEEGVPTTKEGGGGGGGRWTRESFQRGIIKAALPSDLESLLGPWLLLRGVQGGERVRYSLSPPRSVRYPSATLSRRSPPFPPNQPANHPPIRLVLVPSFLLGLATSNYHPPSRPSYPPTPRKHTHTEASRST